MITIFNWVSFKTIGEILISCYVGKLNLLQMTSIVPLIWKKSTLTSQHLRHYKLNQFQPDCFPENTCFPRNTLTLLPPNLCSRYILFLKYWNNYSYSEVSPLKPFLFKAKFKCYPLHEALCIFFL